MTKIDKFTLMCYQNNTEYPFYFLQSKSKDVAHLFPFIDPEESTGEIGEFYQQIVKILVEVHNTQQESEFSLQAIDRLISLTKERYVNSGQFCAA